ncbi:uncharacterized protein LOC107981014 [Nasonia vitripennis]|uniref:DUF7041 domain-containing protein n=1 Tax=Nasonia vitripennis TaxID=7425 RepID=A0A7M7IQK6_NASVI|nr:uncharacterized protein LOC107981014 [Nasonia vitripennis]
MPETPVELAARLQRELDEARAAMAHPITRVEAYRSPKLPAFIRADPGMWFNQVEASFRYAHIMVEGTKADCIIEALDQEAMTAIRDIALIEPQPPDVYVQIKNRLITAFSASTESKFRKLPKGLVLNDGKPSLILNRLRSLDDGAKCDDAIIKSVFLEQLQHNHRVIIVASDISDLNKLATLADKIVENSPSEARLSAVNVNSDISSLASEVKRLADSFEKFSTRVGNLESSFKAFKGRSRSKSRDSSGLCLAHRKYPDNPTKYKKWCSEYSKWASKN